MMSFERPDLTSLVARIRRLGHAGLAAVFLVGAGLGWEAVVAAALFGLGWLSGASRLGLPLWALLGYDLVVGVGLWWLFGPVSGADFLPFAVVAIGAVLLDARPARGLVAAALATVPIQVGLHFLAHDAALPLFHPSDPIPDTTFLAAATTQAGILAVVGVVMLRIGAMLREGRAALRADLERQRELVQSKDRFLATVSHELRTPLTSLRGFTATLLADDPEPAERREFLGLIRDQAEELTSLIEDLITFSRMEAGQLTIMPEPVTVADAVWRVVAGLGARGEAVVVQADAAAVAHVDPLRFRQMLRNLIDNGLKYGRPPVVVEADADGAEVLLRVLDHGDGLDPDAAERVFAPYERLVDDPTMSLPGLGLGLSIVRQLAEAHRGSVEVVPQGFELRLPSSGRVGA